MIKKNVFKKMILPILIKLKNEVLRSPRWETVYNTYGLWTVKQRTVNLSTPDSEAQNSEFIYSGQ